MEPLITIAIPTFNRAGCLGKAIEAALAQNYSNFNVLVVDDGSTDETVDVIDHYLSDERLCSIRLGSNVGTAQAKNVAIMMGRYDAITFHDSDDVPDPNKVLLQSRAMFAPNHHADKILDWAAMGIEPGSDLEVDVVVGAHRFIKLDGSVHTIQKRISLVDDFFPNLQFPSSTEGDWVLINSGLFRRRVFEALGGYLDSIEEDREIRDRTVAAGCIYYFISEPLLTKIESSNSLTVSDDTNYTAKRRDDDRREVWRRAARYRNGGWGKDVARHCRVAINLDDIVIEDISRPELLTLNASIPTTDATRRRFAALLALHGNGEPSPGLRTTAI